MSRPASWASADLGLTDAVNELLVIERHQEERLNREDEVGVCSLEADRYEEAVLVVEGGMARIARIVRSVVVVPLIDMRGARVEGL